MFVISSYLINGLKLAHSGYLVKNDNRDRKEKVGVAQRQVTEDSPNTTHAVTPPLFFKKKCFVIFNIFITV